jgi:hypothetical protein
MAEEKGNLFMQLVFMFQTAAMQQMGKVINPLTKKIEKDLSQAKFSVDMLGMIEERTKGNLSDEEKKILDHILFELRMNYVDEVEKEQKVATEEKIAAEEKVKEEKKPPKPKKGRKKRAKSEGRKR